MPQPITRSIVNDDLTVRFTGTSTIVGFMSVVMQ